MAADPKALKRRYDNLKSARATWEHHWDEVAKYVMPQYQGLFHEQPTNQTKGRKRREYQFDSTAPIALRRFASVMESMITPRNQKWHRLRPSSPELARDREVALWFDEVTELLFRYRYEARANYANNQNEVYMSLGSFGTGALFIDEPAEEMGLRYRSIPLADIFLLLNHEGLVDTVFRRDVMTARQIVQKWGADAVTKKVRDTEAKQPDEEFEVLHIVQPREGREPGRIDGANMPWASIYMLVDEDHILSEGGYRTFPYAVSRHSVAPREAYGRSPAMEVLPNIKVVNEQKKTHLKIGHRRADPPVLLHDDGVLDGFSLKPGALNFGGVNQEGRLLAQPFAVGDPVTNDALMEQERQPINDAFLVTLFQILVDNGTMTATEVIQRTQEKAQLITPIMGRQEAEALEPMIQRELDILEAQGLLPEMPTALLEAGADFRIEYESPLARAAKAEEAGGLIRSLEIVMQYVQVSQDPSPLDFYDWDTITPDLQRNQGLPERWRRTMKQVAAIRQNRAQQAAAQQAIEAAPAMASLAKSEQ